LTGEGSDRERLGGEVAAGDGEDERFDKLAR